LSTLAHAPLRAVGTPSAFEQSSDRSEPEPLRVQRPDAFHDREGAAGREIGSPREFMSRSTARVFSPVCLRIICTTAAITLSTI
jgi:hypothetical protein